MSHPYKRDALCYGWLFFHKPNTFKASGAGATRTMVQQISMIILLSPMPRILLKLHDVRGERLPVTKLRAYRRALHNYLPRYLLATVSHPPMLRGCCRAWRVIWEKRLKFFLKRFSWKLTRRASRQATSGWRNYFMSWRHQAPRAAVIHQWLNIAHFPQRELVIAPGLRLCPAQPVQDPVLSRFLRGQAVVLLLQT